MKNQSLLFQDAPVGALPGRARTRGWRGVLVVVLLLLGTRLVVWTAAYTGAALRVLIVHGIEPPLNPRADGGRADLGNPESDISRGFQQHVTQFRPLLHWDASHYRSIVEGGYQYEPPPPGTPSNAGYNIAFFPLYPLACAAVAPLIGTPAALVLVSNLAALLAAVLLYAYVRERIDEASAICAVAVTFCWPTACFHSFGYAESLNLLCTVVVMLLADRGWFVPAALVCGLGTATRPTAVALVPVLMLVYWASTNGPLLRRLIASVGLAALGSLGGALYGAYLTYRFGSLSVYFDNQRAGWLPPIEGSQWLSFLLFARVWDGFKYLGRAVRDFPSGLLNLTEPMAWNIPATLAILLLCLGGLARVPRRFRPYLLLGPLIFAQRYLVSGWSGFGMESMGRCIMQAAPAYIILAVWCTREWKPGWRCALLVALLLLQANCALRFGLGDWAG